MLRANIAGLGFYEIGWRDGRLSEVTRLGYEDGSEPYCSPGFIDLQINGIAGVDFGAPDLAPEAVLRVLPLIFASGVTTFCPTVITNTHQNLCQSFRVLEEARRISPEFDRAALCYHLEGPYLSSGESRGAHNPLWMRDPSDDEFAALQEAARGRIGIVTIAPERTGAPRFIRQWTDAGVTFSIGHTDADAAHIYSAIEAGAQMSTHLGNGCPERIHRHRSPVWAQLASPDLSASLICDGFHLTPEFTRVAYGMKGAERTILITDAIHVAGLPPGAYQLGGMPVELEGSGRVFALENPGSLAGSTLRMNQAIARFGQMARVPPATALAAATRNPARLLARYQVCGSLEPGQPANLATFRPLADQLEILATYLEGTEVTP